MEISKQPLRSKLEVIREFQEETQDRSSNLTATEFWKPVDRTDIAKIALVEQKVARLADAGYAPRLLRKEPIRDDYYPYRYFWERVTGKQFIKMGSPTLFNKQTAKEIAKLVLATRAFGLYHADGGAHNIIWTGNNPGRFKPAVYIDLDSMADDRFPPAMHVQNFSEALIDGWAGLGISATLSDLNETGELEQFMPNTYEKLKTALKDVKRSQGQVILQKFSEEPIRNILEVQGRTNLIDPMLFTFVLRGFSQDSGLTIEDLQRFAKE